MRIRAAALSVAIVPAALAAVAIARTHAAAQRALRNTEPVGGTIAVFGCTAMSHGPSSVLKARLDHAIDLYRSGRGRRLAMTGGVPPLGEDHPAGGADEVAAMVEYARLQGVRSEDIIEARPGQNTREQIASIRAVAVDQGLGPVVAVSSAYHMARIAAEAERQGFTVQCSSPADDPDVTNARRYRAQLVADAAAAAWYALPDRVASRVDTAAGSARHLAVLVGTGEISWSEVLHAYRGR